MFYIIYANVKSKVVGMPTRACVVA